jgi:hypothetical protein
MSIVDNNTTIIINNSYIIGNDWGFYIDLEQPQPIIDKQQYKYQHVFINNKNYTKKKVNVIYRIDEEYVDDSEDEFMMDTEINNKINDKINKDKNTKSIYDYYKINTCIVNCFIIVTTMIVTNKILSISF